MTDIIKISKINEAYVKIFCEPSISAELSEYFSFFVPGYNFTPAFRNKTWNGKIYLYNKQTSQIYCGLINYIESFAKERNYTIIYDDKVLQTTSFSIHEAKEYANSLQIQSRNKDIDARDYQIEAFAYCIRNRRQMLISPTASGKSLIAYLITRYMTDQNKKGLIIVPTTSLVEQLYSDFQDYSTKNGWSVEDNIHRIYSGREKSSDKLVTISTWQSLYTLPKQYFNYEWVIGDEAHNFKAKSLTTIMTNLDKASLRIGMTGTLDGTKCIDANTLVTTIQGKKKIKNLTKNDFVLSYNEKTKTKEYKKVLNVFNNGKRKKMIKITLNEKTIITTPEHLFFTINRGWVQAKNLTLEDELLHSSNTSL
jgi:hypothetical protein